MRKVFSAALFASVLSFGLLANAGEAPKQNHHCKMPDGTMDPAKTHKECTAAKGKWVKDAAAAEGKAEPGKAEAGKAEAGKPKPEAGKAEAKPADTKPAPAPAPTPAKK
jgi:hypothetical protein